MKTVKFEKKYYLMILAECFISLLRIFQRSIWADEIFSVQLVKNPYKEIIIGTMKDFHPPLYYFINRFMCSIFGFSIPIYKLTSLLPMVLLAFIGFKWLSKHFDDLSGFIFASLVLLMPTAHYNTEIRMYSWALFFVTLFAFTIIDGAELGNNKKILVASIFAILGAFTHYFVLLIVGSIYFFYLIKYIAKKKNIKYLIGSIIICLVVYSPWLLIVFKQMSSEDAYSMGLNSLAYYLKPFAGFVCIVFGTMQNMANITLHELLLTAILALLFFVAIMTFIYKHFKESDISLVKSICILYVFVFVLIYLCGCAMDLMSHKFVSRYLLPSVGILYIVLAVSISYFVKDNKGIIRNIVVCSIAFIVLLDFGMMVYSEAKTDKEQDRFISYVENEICDGDLVLTDSRLFGWNVFDYYFNDMDYKLCLDTESLNRRAENHDKNVYYIHNINDAAINNPGDGWEYIISSELAENRVELYKYVADDN
ncbi:glycosyltransferase family 39 protein [Butyrivibrio sp. XPD2006]|uniref:glycosyltransferase family 39 protein n=1 Tax=Butyrivibrio sp. XPD2006 TaxID=1280668 RepID=UPI0003B67D00|nr:glycosyltransferase family 39 protein [Butyrivibrio sp. XPD2006]